MTHHDWKGGTRGGVQADARQLHGRGHFVKIPPAARPQVCASFLDIKYILMKKFGFLSFLSLIVVKYTEPKIHHLNHLVMQLSGTKHIYTTSRSITSF